MTDYELKLINEYKSGKSTHQVARENGTTYGVVYKILTDNNIPRRSFSEAGIKLKCNYDFFKQIDTEEKAYFLGLLYSDGNVINSTMQICLKADDVHILEDFKKAMGSEHAIRNDRANKRFSIANVGLVKDLHNLGCVPCKSLTLEWPKEGIVPDYLMHHFARGAFDGDGSVSHYIMKSNGHIRWHFSLVSTYHFLEGYQSFLRKHIPILYPSKLTKEKRNQAGRVFYLNYCGMNLPRFEAIYNLLYKDATVYLKRKKVKFEEIHKMIYEQRYM